MDNASFYESAVIASPLAMISLISSLQASLRRSFLTLIVRAIGREWLISADIIPNLLSLSTPLAVAKKDLSHSFASLQICTRGSITT